MTSDLRERLNAQLRARLDALARHLYPSGEKIGRSWRCGSVDIDLTDGYWGDWDGATLRKNKSGRFVTNSKNLIDLWLHAQGCSLPTGLQEIASWLGVSLDDLSKPETTKAADEPVERKLELPPLRLPSRSELRRLAELRGIPVQGLVIAARRGFLYVYFDPCEKVMAWCITDSARKSAVARRLDGEPWQQLGGCKSKTVKGSWGSWPIGLLEAEAYTDLALCEGAPDFISALALGQNLAPVCLPGAAMGIPESQIPRFSGKRVTIYQHNDPAGLRGAQRWEEQLAEVATVTIHICQGDLNDEVKTHFSQRQHVTKVIDRRPAGNFARRIN